MNFAFFSGQPGVGRNLAFLGTNKSDWQPIHGYAGMIMVLLVLVHLILNFGFITSMTKTFFKREESSVPTYKPAVVPTTPVAKV